MLQEKLLTSHHQEAYDPFVSPPDLQKAEDHRKATCVGIDLDEEADLRVCPCCENIIEKEPIALNCADEELLYLGVGYPLFYKLTRYFAVIIGMIFLISGSGFYFLVTLDCKSECVRFLGIPIINLEMSGQQSAKVADVVNVVTAFTIFVVAMYIKWKIYKDINILEEKRVSPELYTIMIQNLPEDVNEEQLIEWVKQKFSAKPILINFAYNVAELSETYKKRQDLTISINKQTLRRKDYEDGSDESAIIDERVQDITEQIKKCDQILNNYKHQEVSCRKIGTVFVTFSQAKIADAIIRENQKSFLNSFLRNLFSIIKAPLMFRGNTVVVSKAPAPREVIWENLSFSFFKSFLAEIIFVSTMVMLIILAFRLQFLVVNYAYDLRRKSEVTRDSIVIFQALVMALIVVLVNSLLRLVIKFFAYVKKHHSFSTYYSSFCFYYSLMYILNTCFMIYIVHSHRQFQNLEGLEEDHVLIYDIHLIMLANAFSEPLFKIFDPLMWVRIVWKSYVGRMKKQKNPYTQAYVNQLWQGYEISNADNYQYIFRILVVTTWFAHCAPFGVIISLIGLLCDYWIGKYLLLRYYKRPENISKEIAMPMIMALELLPLIYICGVLQFTYKVSDSQNLFSFLTQFLQYGITTTVLFISIIGYFIYSKPKKAALTPVHYDEVEVMFPYNYETENPITKLKGQIKYLYGVLKRGTNKNDAKLIESLLQMSAHKRQSRDDLMERQSQIVKIKRKNLKRLNTLEKSMQFKSIEMKNINSKNGKKNPTYSSDSEDGSRSSS